MASRTPDLILALHGVLYTSIAIIFLIWVGNALCKLILKASGLTAAMNQRQAAKVDATVASGQPAPAPPLNARAGGVIGAFERLVLVIGILTGSWEVLAAVVALKTVARFKELDERLDAEYFLIGSLFSILWAICVAAAWIAYDKAYGLDITGSITAFVTSFGDD